MLFYYTLDPSEAQSPRTSLNQLQIFLHGSPNSFLGLLCLSSAHGDGLPVQEVSGSSRRLPECVSALNEVSTDLVLDARVVLESGRVQARGLHGADAKHNGKSLSG